MIIQERERSMKAIANSTFSIPMQNETDTEFTKDKEYEYRQMSSGTYVIMDDNKHGLILENDKDFFNCFRLV
jgi:hypothetical protein